MAMPTGPSMDIPEIFAVSNVSLLDATLRLPREPCLLWFARRKTP